MKLFRTQYPVTGRHLYAWHVNDKEKMGWQNKAHAWNTSLKDPSLSITLHSHIGHNKLTTWLTGGQVNAFCKSLKGLTLNIYFQNMGNYPEHSRFSNGKIYTNNKRRRCWGGRRSIEQSWKDRFIGIFWKAGSGSVLTYVIEKKTKLKQHVLAVLVIIPVF